MNARLILTRSTKIVPPRQEPPGSGSGCVARLYRVAGRFWAVLLAVVVFGCTRSAQASFLDLFRSPDEEAKQERLLEAYGEAAYLENDGQSLGSIESLRKCVELDPESVYFRLRLVNAYLEVHDVEKAESALKPLRDRSPQTGEILRARAQVALQRQDYDRALELYEESLEQQPGNIAAMQALVILYFEHKHDLEKTLEISHRILQISGRNLHALLYGAEASALTGDVKEAAEFFQRILRNHPSFVDRLDDLAQRLLQRGRREDALALYREGVLLMPSSDLLRQGFETLAGDGDTTATLEAYRELTLDAEGNAEIRRLYAERLIQARHWAEAEAEYRKILASHPNDVAAHIAMAEIALQRGDVEEALERFEEALERHPTDPEVYATVARLYLMRGELEKAERLLDRALVYGEKNPTALVLMADVCERTGRTEEAETYLKRALDALPANPTLLSLLSGFYARTGRAAEAAEVLEQMLAVRPRDLSLYNELFRYYVRNDRQNSARLLIERGRKTFEDSTEFDLLIGQIGLQEDALDLARESLGRVIASDPAHLDAHILLANLYLSEGRGEKAVGTLKQIESYVRDVDQQYAWRLALGSVYMELRRWEDASKEFKAARELNPEAFDVYSGLIESLIRAGRIDESIEVLNDAVRRFQIAKPKEVQLLRAQALVAQRQYDRAKSILTTLAREHAEDVDVVFNLAALYGEIGNLDKAEEAYRTVIELDPDSATAYNNLGYLFAEENVRLDEAETLVRKALELRPGAGFILDSLGWIYYRKGDLDRAQEYLEEAKRRTTGDPEVYEHLGDVHRKQGDRETALDYYQASLELDPGRADVEKKIGELNAEVKR